MPAAAVIRGEQALFKLIGRKGFVGCFLSQIGKNKAQLYNLFETKKL